MLLLLALVNVLAVVMFPAVLTTLTHLLMPPLWLRV